MNKELRDAQNMNRTMNQKLEKAESTAQHADQDLANIKNRMKDLETTKSCNDDAVHAMENRLRVGVLYNLFRMHKWGLCMSLK